MGICSNAINVNVTIETTMYYKEFINMNLQLKLQLQL